MYKGPEQILVITFVKKIKGFEDCLRPTKPDRNLRWSLSLIYLTSRILRILIFWISSEFSVELL